MANKSTVFTLSIKADNFKKELQDIEKQNIETMKSIASSTKAASEAQQKLSNTINERTKTLAAGLQGLKKYDSEQKKQLNEISKLKIDDAKKSEQIALTEQKYQEKKQTLLKKIGVSEQEATKILQGKLQLKTVVNKVYADEVSLLQSLARASKSEIDNNKASLANSKAREAAVKAELALEEKLLVNKQKVHAAQQRIETKPKPAKINIVGIGASKEMLEMNKYYADLELKSTKKLAQELEVVKDIEKKRFLAKRAFAKKGDISEKQVWDTKDIKSYYETLERESQKKQKLWEQEKAAIKKAGNEAAKIKRQSIADLRRQYKETYVLTAEQKRFQKEVEKLKTAYKANAISTQEYRSQVKQLHTTLSETDKKQKANTTTIKQKEKATTNLTNATVRHLRQLETLAIAMYSLSQAYQSTIGAGIQLNRMIEDNTGGIAALVSANTQMVTSTGKVVDNYEKFTMGAGIAGKTMLDLKEASVETMATFPQLTQIFQQVIGHTLSMGDSFGETTDDIINNTIEFSKSISNIAASIGMPMQKAEEEIRSLISGNASTDSLIAIMLFGSPSEANKALREAKKRGTNGVKDLMESMTKSFDPLKDIDTHTKALLALENQWNSMTIEMSKPIFDDLTQAFKNFAQGLKEDQDAIVETFGTFYEGIKKGVGYLDNLAVALTAYKVATFATTTTIFANTSAIVASNLVYDIATKKLAILTTAQALFNATVMKNPYIIGATVVATAGYGLYEYFSNEADRLDDLSKKMKTSANNIAKMQLDTIIETRKAIGKQLREAKESLNELAKDKDKYTLFEKISLEPKDEDTIAWRKQKKVVEELLETYNKYDKVVKERTTKSSDGNLIANIGIDDSYIATIIKEVENSKDKVLKLQDEQLKKEEQLAKLKEVFAIQEKANLTKESKATLEKIRNVELSTQKTKDKISTEKVSRLKDELEYTLDLQIANDKLNGTQQTKVELLSSQIEKQYKLMQLATGDDKKKLEIDWLEKQGELLDAHNEQIKKEEEATKKKNEAIEETYRKYIQITGSDYDSWLLDTNSKMVELAATGSLTAEQLQKAWDSMQTEHELSLNIEIDEIDNTMLKDTVDYQNNLVQSAFLWMENLNGVAGSFGTLGLAVADFYTNSNASMLQQKELEDTYNKNRIKALKKHGKDSKVVQKLDTKYNKDKLKLNKKVTKREIDSYADIAGASKGLFKEKTVAYKALEGIENGMHMARMAMSITELAMDSTKLASIFSLQTADTAATATHVANSTTKIGMNIAEGTTKQSTEGDPYTATARVVAMVTLLTGIAAAFTGGSGGGGGASAPKMAGGAYGGEYTQDFVKANNELITDRLDRQIELLESIDKAGTTQTYKIDLAGAKYTSALTDLSFSLSEVPQILADRTEQVNKDYLATIVEAGKRADIKDIGTIEQRADGSNKIVSLNATTLNGNIKGSLDFIYELSQSLDTLAKLNTSVLASSDTWGTEAIINNINDAQDAVNEFALNMLDVVSTMKDASDDYQDIYDDLTQTTTYSNKRLQKANIEVAQLVGDRSLPDFLSEQIELTQAVEQQFDTSVQEVLLSQNVEDMKKQSVELSRLTNILDDAMAGGTEETLNALESIKLYSEALVASDANIKTWNDSFKTEQELAKELSETVGVTLAENTEQLNSNFKQLQGGIGGLTDAELEALDANKSYLESIGEIADSTDTLTDKLEAYSNAQDLIEQDIATQWKEAQDRISSLSNTFSTLNQSIEDTISTLLGGSDSLDAQDRLIEDFWSKRGELDVLLSKDGNLTKTEEARLKVLVGDVNKLSTEIQKASKSDNSKITNELVGELGDLSYELDKDAKSLSIEDKLDELTDTAVNYLGEDSDMVKYLKSIDDTLTAQDFATYQKQQELEDAYKTVTKHQEDANTAAIKEQTKQLLDQQISDILSKYGLDVTDEAIKYLEGDIDKGQSLSDVEVTVATLSAQEAVSDTGAYAGGTYKVQQDPVTGEVSTAIAAALPEPKATLPTAASTPKVSSDESFIKSLYAKAGETPDAAGVNYWLGDVAKGQSHEDIKASFQTLFPDKTFAVGTPKVPYDMIAQIHKDEMIIPKTFSDGLRDGDLSITANRNYPTRDMINNYKNNTTDKEVVELLAKVVEKLDKIELTNKKMQENIDDVTQGKSFRTKEAS